MTHFIRLELSERSQDVPHCSEKHFVCRYQQLQCDAWQALGVNNLCLHVYLYLCFVFACVFVFVFCICICICICDCICICICICDCIAYVSTGARQHGARWALRVTKLSTLSGLSPPPFPDSQSSKSSLFPQWVMTMSLKRNHHIWFYFTNSDPILLCPKCIFLCNFPKKNSLFLQNSIFQTFFWPILEWQQHQGKYVARGGGSIWSFWWWWWCIFSKCIFRMYFFQKRIFKIFQVLFFKYYL